MSPRPAPNQWFRLLLAFGFLSAVVARGEFAATTSETHFTVDTGAGLVFRIDRDDGDVESILFQGKELQTRGRKSGINSGLGGHGTTTRLAVNPESAVITVETDETNGVVKNLTHYYIARKGVNAIIMATHAEHPPSNGELRWITRLRAENFPKVVEASDLRGTRGPIESKDIFGRFDGTTRSKYYGNQRAIDLSDRGVAGPGIGLLMIYGNRESASGGPFFRDIQNQSGSNVEVYNYMFSGHNQTEPFRPGVLHGPYILSFRSGGKPAIPDLRFVASLGLKGYVGADARGELTLDRLDGRVSGFDYVISVSNERSQSWGRIGSADGSLRLVGIKPGRHLLRVYKGELEVESREVEITAGRVTRTGPIAITRDPSARSALWRIGEWDGTPLEFRNGRNITLMHPSDKRQASWKCPPFLVGQSRASDFPSCQWADVNANQRIDFHLAEIPDDGLSLRVGITAAFAGARPRVNLNGRWNSPIPESSRQPDSRSITIGTYRGNNHTFTYRLPSSALRKGANFLTLSPVSGRTGDAFLSPGYAIDCVDLLAE